MALGRSKIREVGGRVEIKGPFEEEDFGSIPAKIWGVGAFEITPLQPSAMPLRSEIPTSYVSGFKFP